MPHNQNNSVIYRAGVIPYVIENNIPIMLFMKPSSSNRGGDCYQISKGKVETGETIKSAALREANEELGLLIDNVIDVQEVGTFMGRTTIFVAEVKNVSNFSEHDSETGSVCWMTEDQFMEVGRQLHKPIVEACAKIICRLHEIVLNK